MNKKTSERIVFWLFLLPALFSFTVIVVIPFFMGFYYSMTDWTAIAGLEINWVGFENYKNMFGDLAFQFSFIVTFAFTLLSVISINFVALLLAVLVTREIRGKNFLRAGFFVPNLIGGLVLGYIWQFIFKSIIPSIGGVLNIEAIENLLVLADPTLSLLGVIAAYTWQYAGYIMMIYIAALVNVPKELIEASNIDGANYWQQFRAITLPLIAQAFTITSFLTLVSAFKQFDILVALTSGGPSTVFGGEIVNSTELLALHIYNVAFTYNNMAEGQARAIVFFLVLSIVSIVQVYQNMKREVEM